MKKIIFTTFSILLCCSTSWAASLKLTTYFPAPSGRTDRSTTNRLTFNPIAAPLPNGDCMISTIGLTYYDASSDTLRTCNGSGKWSATPGVWKQSGDNILLSDTLNPTLKKVAIGTQTPTEMMLTLGGDGGIISSGAVLAGADFTASGDGTKFIWWPRMAAMRAGQAAFGSWDKANIGVFSMALGFNPKASGGSSAVMGGSSNTASGQDSFVGGGGNNVASGERASIVGGASNIASGIRSFVGGGGDYDVPSSGNTAAGINAAVVGGSKNNANGDNSIINGGFSGTTSGYAAAITGGSSNTASAYSAMVAGGYGNTASGDQSLVSGKGNTASAENSAVTGGLSNTASQLNAVVVGGNSNIANGQNSAIIGAQTSSTTNSFAAVVGGFSNSASGSGAVVIGGHHNQASGSNAVVISGQTKSASGNNAVSIAGTASGATSFAVFGRAAAPNSVAIGAEPYVDGPAGFSAVVGGYETGIVNSESSFVGGGYTVTITNGVRNGIISGYGNSMMDASMSGILAGDGNRIGDFTYLPPTPYPYASAIIAGQSNMLSGSFSIMLGGGGNTAESDYSIVGGYGMNLSKTADNTFVFGRDSSGGSPAITTPDAAIFFPGNVNGKLSINEKLPQADLHVSHTGAPGVVFIDSETAGTGGQLYIRNIGGSGCTLIEANHGALALSDVLCPGED